MQTKLTFEEIEKIITSDLFRENEMSPEHFMQDETWTYSGLMQTNYAETGYSPEFLDALKLLGDFELVDGYGGEGFGERYWSVYHFKTHDIFIKFDGWYQSYRGSEFEKMFQVVPEEVTVIKYKPVNA